jgi:hypothetical protein
MVIKICKAEIKAKHFIKFSKPDIYLGVMLSKKNRSKFTIIPGYWKTILSSLCVYIKCEDS